jgi:hypothetical protein
MANTITRVPPDNTAWGPKHIAIYLDVSERHVRDIRREDDTFPTPPDGRQQAALVPGPRPAVGRRRRLAGAAGHPAEEAQGGWTCPLGES